MADCVSEVNSCAVVFKGELVPGMDDAVACQRIMHALKLDEPKAKRLLASSQVVLKKGLPNQEAQRYQKLFERLGLVCHILDLNAKDLNTNKQKTKLSPKSGKASSGKMSVEEQIDNAFQNGFDPTEPTVGYQVGVVATALLMMVLPLIYVAFTASVGYDIVWHAVNNLDVFLNVGSGVGAILIYVMPIIIGTVLLFFLIKPIFARPAVVSRPVFLDSEQHSLFFQFVRRICAEMDVPEPSEIRVDTSVKASVQLKRAMISNELVLTVGMPLIMGFNSREMAGVLAHEFGYFAHYDLHVGMRLGYIISSINRWFYRVVFERDAWDVRLEHWVAKSDNLVGLMLGHSIRACLWLTRGLLQGLMRIGILVSRFMSRQMEFDADRYEVKIAGSDQFRRTALSLNILSAVYGEANRLNMDARDEGLVAENIPKLILLLRDMLSEESKRDVEHFMLEKQSSLWDVRPSDYERIDVVEKEELEALFQLELPAYYLLADYESLCQQVTLGFYRDNNLQVEKCSVVSAEQVIEVSAARAESLGALEHYFNGCFIPHRVIPLSGSLECSGDDLTQLQMLIDQLNQLEPEYKASIEGVLKAEERVNLLRIAYAHLEAGLGINADAFGVPTSDLMVVAEEANLALATYDDCSAKLTNLEKVMGRRLMMGLAIAVSKQDQASQKHILVLCRALTRLHKMNERLPSLISCGVALSDLYAVEIGDDHSTVIDVCKSYVQLCNDEVDVIMQILDKVPDPFVSDEGTLAAVVQQWIDCRLNGVSNEIEAGIRRQQAVVDAISYLNGRVTGALAKLALQAEEAEGLTPTQSALMDEEGAV